MSYFKPEEWACKCGCGDQKMDEEFIQMINIARSFSDIPFVINSGKRCRKHNKNEGSKPTSSHLKGMAADISCLSSYDRFRIIEGVVDAGFMRVGIGDGFIHVDNDNTKDPEVIWLY